MEPLFFIMIALIIGAATRHFLKNTPLPYTVLLLIFGLVIGLCDRYDLFHMLGAGHFGHAVDNAVSWAGEIDPHLILFVFLPILIFEAAFSMDVHTFKKTSGNVAILAIPGIIIALLLTGVLVMWLNTLGLGFQGWGWALAFLLGSVVSATDPVAVVSLLKELGASKKLATLIEGESLLNDGTAIVLFFLFIGILPFETHFYSSQHGILPEFCRVALGGMLIGMIISGIILIWVKKVFNDAMIEITLIVTAAYLTFYVAEHFLHVSGVLGLVTVGLAMAGAGKTRISAEVQHFLHEFWEFAAYIANTLIFVIVGVVIAKRVVFTKSDFIALIILYIGCHVIRALVIQLFLPVMKRIGYGLSYKEAVIVWYGGLRGAVGLALALIFAGELSRVAAHDPALLRIADQFLFYSAGIVALTLLINATTIKYFIKILGLTRISDAKAMMFANTMKVIERESADEMDVISKDRFMNGADWQRVKNYLTDRKGSDVSRVALAETDSLAETRRRVLEKEKSSYWNQFKEGLLEAGAYSRLSENIEEILDQNGAIPLDERDYLEFLWGAPGLYSKLRGVPFIRTLADNLLTDRLAICFSIAHGFAVAQEEASNMVSAMTFDLNMDGHIDEEETQLKNKIEEELLNNRLKAQKCMNDIQLAFPNISRAIKTRHAIRTLLNFERSKINRLTANGLLENDEAERMVIDVDRRIKHLADSPLVIHALKPLDMLRQAGWLKSAAQNIIDEVVSIAEKNTHHSGQTLMKQGESGETGMVVIAQGSVSIIHGGKTMDILGAGSIIGEMSLMTGAARSATVQADTPVTALWLSAKQMQPIIAKSPELESALLRTAGFRMAENMLSDKPPFNTWPLIKLRRWINNGETRKTAEDEVIELNNRIAVMFSGSAADTRGGHIFQAPAIIDIAKAVFTKDAQVFISASLLDISE